MDNNLHFLSVKIQEIKSGIFYNFSTSVLKIPNAVIDVKYIDDLGKLYFYVHKPGQSLVHYDHEFPAQLQFYKKGIGYRVKVHGKAVIVDDPEELNNISFMDVPQTDEYFLVKIKMTNAEYYEPWINRKRDWFSNLKESIYKWLYNDSESRPYYFGDAAA